MNENYKNIRYYFYKDAEELADKLLDFVVWLEREPCTNDGNCVGMSVSRRMCTACRLRLAFTHTVGISFVNETGGPTVAPVPSEMVNDEMDRALQETRAGDSAILKHHEDDWSGGGGKGQDWNNESVGLP
jgi:hypothetical protein